MEEKPNEIRVVRVYNAPVQLVWDAWTKLEHVEKWWGPRGFTLTTHSKELRVGGSWRYTMHGPDGTDYPNITVYHEVEPLRKLVYDHGATETTPPLFRVTVTFTEVDGKTTMDMVSSLPTPEAAVHVARAIKQHSGHSTWDRLAEYVDESATGVRNFVVNRTFEAPIERVFAMFSEPEHLVRWLPPAGMTMRYIRPDIQVGATAFFVMEGTYGAMYAHARYLTIDAPHRLVYEQQFVDEHENPALAPGETDWPAILRNTFLFVAETPTRTRVTVTTETVGAYNEAELAAFIAERSGMTRGWNGSFDALDPLL